MLVNYSKMVPVKHSGAIGPVARANGCKPGAKSGLVLYLVKGMNDPQAFSEYPGSHATVKGQVEDLVQRHSFAGPGASGLASS